MNKQKKTKIKKEINRLRKLLTKKGIDLDKLEIASELINDIAFMTVEALELKALVHEFGSTEEYQNGANQRGRKKSAAFEAYILMTKQKAALIKQLTELIPAEDEGTFIPQSEEQEDDFDKFAKLRECKNESYN